MRSTRVEKHVIHENNEFFHMLDEYCFLSKNLFNHANYIIRKNLSDTNTWMRYFELDKILKQDEEYPDYKKMCYSAAAQQLLRMLDDAWASFFTAIKDWKIHPEKYLGKPEPPKYKNKKKGRCPIYLTNQACKIRENKYVTFPKSFKGMKFKVTFLQKEEYTKFLQCRIVPRGNHIVVEFVYEVEVPTRLEDNGRYIGIDVGIDNLAAVCNNVDLPFYIVDGKGLKSINKYYNKLISHYKSKLSECNTDKYDPNVVCKQKTSRRIKRITSKRNAKVDDYLHKASRWIVNFAKDNDIHIIIVGKNDLWKQNVNLGKKTNQKFTQIPHQRFLNMLAYKAEAYGISVIEHEESYTSKTSFLDDEFPTKHEEYKGKRPYRGLFKSSDGTKVNADSNAGLQIIKKFNHNYNIDKSSARILLQRPKRINVSGTC